MEPNRGPRAHFLYHRHNTCLSLFISLSLLPTFFYLLYSFFSVIMLPMDLYSLSQTLISESLSLLYSLFSLSFFLSKSFCFLSGYHGANPLSFFLLFSSSIYFSRRAKCVSIKLYILNLCLSFCISVLFSLRKAIFL